MLLVWVGGVRVGIYGIFSVLARLAGCGFELGVLVCVVDVWPVFRLGELGLGLL